MGPPKTPPPLKAAQTVAVEDRPAVAGEYMGKAARLYVRTKNFDSAVSSVSLQIVDLTAPQIGALRSEVAFRQEASTMGGGGQGGQVGVGKGGRT